MIRLGLAAVAGALALSALARAQDDPPPPADGGMGAFLEPITLPRLYTRRVPLVVVVWDSEKGDQKTAEAMKEAVLAAKSRLADRWMWLECDVAEEASVDMAEEGGLRGRTTVFVRTPEDGIDEFTMPATVSNLVRFLHLRGIAGDPRDVLQVTSAKDIQDRLQHGAVFVRFYEPWCAHCLRMQRQFESAATLLKTAVTFADVNCAADPKTGGLKHLCDEEDVSEYPTLRLYSNTSLFAAHATSDTPTPLSSPSFPAASFITYKGGRVAAAYELFMHDHRPLLGDGPYSSKEARARTAALKAYTFDTSKPLPSVYPMAGQPMPDLPVDPHFPSGLPSAYGGAQPGAQRTASSDDSNSLDDEL